MALVSTNQFKNGMAIKVDGDLFFIVGFQHVKPGKGGAFVRMKLKNVKSGAVLDKTVRAGEKFDLAHMERKQMQYLYSDGDGYHFMDNDTYDQVAFTPEQLGDALEFLKENLVVEVLSHQGQAMGIEPPLQVELEVVETDPGVKGDTATGGTKPAKLETGAVVQVPLFIEVGDSIKVDTREKSYITRA